MLGGSKTSKTKAVSKPPKQVASRPKPQSVLRPSLLEEPSDEPDTQEAADTDAGEIARMLGLFQASLLKKKNEKAKQVEAAIRDKLDGAAFELQEKIDSHLSKIEAIVEEHKRKRDETIDAIVSHTKKLKSAFERQVGEQLEGIDELERHITQNSKTIRVALGAWDNLSSAQRAEIDTAVEQIQDERNRYRLTVKKKSKEAAASNAQQAFSLALGV
ncbi:hypothetical protein HDU93_008130 [Gonapodya sp. JEL0774]|nr:hypothetical protein HDU93_008130 [Gonapodya sp. JEL0774]